MDFVYSIVLDSSVEDSSVVASSVCIFKCLYMGNCKSKSCKYKFLHIVYVVLYRQVL